MFKLGAVCYALVDPNHISQPCIMCFMTTNMKSTTKTHIGHSRCWDIKFVKMEYGKTKRKPMVVSYDPCPVAKRNHLLISWQPNLAILPAAKPSLSCMLIGSD